jgi:competence protein ComEC
VELDRRIPPWDRRLDAVVLSHPHEDHVAGLALLLDRYDVARVFEPGMRGPGPGYGAWTDRLRANASRLRMSLAAGDRLDVDEIALHVLWPARGSVPEAPPDDGTGINNVSIVMLGLIGDRRFLLAGDVEEEVDPRLVGPGLPPLDLLKVAHHGSRTATTEGFVEAVRPRVAIASAGAGNRFGHPAKATIERLASAGARVYRTDRDGSVAVEFDKTGMRIRTAPRRAAARPAPPRAAIASAAFLCDVPVQPFVSPEVVPPGPASALGYHPADGDPNVELRRCPGLAPSRGPRVRLARR